MDAGAIGWLAATLVIVSAVPYIYRAWRKEIEPNPVSWVIWSVMGTALLLTYWKSGAKENVIPYIFGAINPTLLTIVVFLRSKTREPLTRWEWGSLILGLIALVGWVCFQGDEKKVEIALGFAILADACAAVPTLFFVYRNPLKDRPLAWFLFWLGNIVALFAIRDGDYADYVLPVYMILAGPVIMAPLVLYRIRHRTPLKEWY